LTDPLPLKWAIGLHLEIIHRILVIAPAIQIVAAKQFILGMNNE